MHTTLRDVVLSAWARPVERVGQIEKTNILFGKHEVDWELVRHRSRWEGCIQTDFVEI
jgi:hypothetical protein